MATSFSFNGQIIKIPGVYTTIKSGQTNPPIALDYGTVLVIDTGTGAGWIGGSGFNGELAQGEDTLYVLRDMKEMREFAKGGIWWLLAQPLFRPSKPGVNGVSQVIFARLATTTAAQISYTFTGGGSNGGQITIKVRDEGLVGNGVLASNNNLSKGYAGIMIPGVINPSKFILKFYRGTWKGTDTLNNTDYGDIPDTNAAPELLVQSPEFDNIQTLISWMQNDFTFNKYFLLSSSSVSGTGAVDSGDLSTYNSWNLAGGGTETYNNALLDQFLDIIKDKPISFIFSDKYNTNAQSLENSKLLDHIETVSKYKPELYVGGGFDIGDFANSLATAAFFDSENVTVVHGGVKKFTPNGERVYDSLYKTALVLGREAGLQPQIPLTFKEIDIDGEVHSLTDKEVIQALDAGVLVTRKQTDTFDIVKGINTLQENTFLVNNDGKTHSKQIRRITRQLNKEIIINAYRQILKDPNGVNRNSISEQDMISWLQGFLRTKIASPQQDNLILNFGTITVTRQQDGYFIEYQFTPNSEISFLFFTGLIVNV